MNMHAPTQQYPNVKLLRHPKVRRTSLWRRALLSPELVSGAAKAGDFVVILLCAWITLAVYFRLVPSSENGRLERYLLASVLAAFCFQLGFRRLAGYDYRHLARFRRQVVHVVLVWCGTVALLLLAAFVGKVSQNYSRGWSLTWVIATLAALLTSRVLLRLLVLRLIRLGYLVRNIAIVGGGKQGVELISRLLRSPEEGVSIVGVFDDRKGRINGRICGFPVLGTTDDLQTYVRRMPVDEVIVALPITAEQRLKGLFDKLRLLPVDLRLFADALAGTFSVRGVSYLSDAPVLEIAERPLKNWNALAKSMEDKLLGSLLLLCALPVMAIVAIAIKLEDGGPVFFVQDRFGFNNEVIRVVKFRTMFVGRSDSSGTIRTVRGDPRVTRVGRWLRRLSLDELPQLLNVIRGDMSLVGPRPHAIGMRAGDQIYPEAVTDYFARHRVKPGITGWAQVHGLRGEVDTMEKAKARVTYDLFYIEHWSLSLDMQILFKTLPGLLLTSNAY